ncbi:acyl-CoA dehydrogenase family protein [Luteimicrobium subarcticum]|uniref:Alkylation response protein AidB-like acyl-CoA dehydrogenase n=1 Tax=Luteimicrobium subarcticum TaxID=620910 RepID=A0A2M8WRG3_9MICO|nr:acyl-CoA dehydrogenase family protein [Luteimicrobium subarcticum]PJI93523.1 hypothetical protein CLV34_2097 [Luteimicrobium subarcticum]
MTGAPVRLGPTATPESADATRRLAAALGTVDTLGTDVRATLDWAREIGAWAPHPGSGRTRELWELLASTAALDVGVARILEPHLDAVAVLAQAPDPVDLSRVDADAASTWGVFAAEGPGVRLTASPELGAAAAEGVWVLDGVKPWCSLAGDLSHALVTAWTDEGRRLFAVALRGPGVEAATGPWVSRGLQQVVSAPVSFSGAPAVPVGGPEWYLRRPGFAWGGIGVAACWWGGAVGVARDLAAVATGGTRDPDQVAQAHLGAVDVSLHAARTTLAEASHLVDAQRDGVSADTAPSLLAKRVRGVVARTVEETLQRAAHGLGPGPLTQDERHARRVADLAVYVRQWHAERDDASLGRELLATDGTGW